MNILVTGANGFLGSHLVRRMNQLGFNIYGLVRPNSNLDLIKDLNINLIEGDVTNSLESLNLPSIEMVFHLAAIMGTAKSLRDDLYKVNVKGTENMLQWSLKNKVRRFIHVSSIVALGALTEAKGAITEKSSFSEILRSLHNFESKRQAQELVLDYARTTNLDTVVVNPSLIYGPGDARKTIRKGNLKIAQGKMPFSLPGGVNVVAVEDVVEGMLAAAEKGRRGECYILGGENILTKDLFAMIAQANHQTSPSASLPAWFLKSMALATETFRIRSDINREAIQSLLLYHWCDSAKARTELNYKSRSAREAINASVAWMRENALL